MLFLDLDCCKGTNIKTVEAIDFILPKIDFNTKIILNWQCIDAGGGGTNVGLGEELRKLNCTLDE